VLLFALFPTTNDFSFFRLLQQSHFETQNKQTKSAKQQSTVQLRFFFANITDKQQNVFLQQTNKRKKRKKEAQKSTTKRKGVISTQEQRERMKEGKK